MRHKLLILSMYPAPYRVELFERLSRRFDCDVFLETADGDQRHSDWFQKGAYTLLSAPEGLKRYQSLDLHDYDLVLAFEYSTKEGVKLVMRCKKQKIPYVINCDGVILEQHGNFIKDMLKKHLIKGAAGYFASGENAKKYLVRYGADPDKVFIHTFSELEDGDILKAPVSAEEKQRLREKLGLPVRQKIAVAVGRFIPLKRYGELISAWSEMPQDVTLLLIGGGSERESYERIIKEKHLNNIIIEDFHPKNELTEYYRASDIFVHPTSYDVWGLVVNEAMANGLPVVASDHCVAALELIRDGENGFLVAMGDDGAMCKKAARILSDPALYSTMAQNAPETIRPYTMHNMAQTQAEAIQAILS